MLPVLFFAWESCLDTVLPVDVMLIRSKVVHQRSIRVDLIVNYLVFSRVDLIVIS